jgi:hypothetical protein
VVHRGGGGRQHIGRLHTQNGGEEQRQRIARGRSSPQGHAHGVDIFPSWWKALERRGVAVPVAKLHIGRVEFAVDGTALAVVIIRHLDGGGQRDALIGQVLCRGQRDGVRGALQIGPRVGDESQVD